MGSNIFSVSYFWEILPKVAGKLNVTLYLTVIATICALLLGTVLAIIAYYRIPVLYQLSRFYIAVMRGTPAMPQLFFFYYGLALVSTTITNMSATTAVAVIISLNMAAFMSESIRAALMSVDVGQREAASSLGMNGLQTVVRIILPQAVRVALPPLFNDVINIIKLTSLAFMVGVKDIMGVGKAEAALSLRYFETYAAIMLVYFVVITIFSFFSKRLERVCNAAF